MTDQERAPYGRRKKKQRGDLQADRRVYAGESYYGTPALKPSYYKWLIAWYFLLGGISGASGVIASVAEWVGHERDEMLVRVARYVAFVNIAISPVLLIADIHTPQRFYNMLRIFRRTSPLSIGTWSASVYGLVAGLSALGHLLGDRGHASAGRRMARLLALPTALFGAIVSVYTATVLAATSVPMWASAYRQLPVLFATTATTSATATLSLILTLLGGPKESIARLERLSLVATVAEGAALAATERQLRATGQARTLDSPERALAYRGGAWGIGLLLPFLLHAIQLLRGRHSRGATLLASVATLVGSLALRAVLLFAGNESARKPEMYFTLAQPENEAWMGGGQ